MKVRVALIVAGIALSIPAYAQTPEQQTATALGSQIGSLYLQNIQQRAVIEDLQKQLVEKDKMCPKPPDPKNEKH